MTQAHILKGKCVSNKTGQRVKMKNCKGGKK